MNKLPLAKTDNLLTQEVNKETLIYNLETNKAICLNETVAFIFQYCDGKTTFEDCKKLSKGKFNDDLILLTLNELNKHELLAGKFETGFTNDRMSRRNMIAKYGSMTIALPIITAIVAPTAVNAASGSVCTLNAPGCIAPTGTLANNSSSLIFGTCNQCLDIIATRCCSCEVFSRFGGNCTLAQPGNPNGGITCQGGCNF